MKKWILSLIVLLLFVLPVSADSAVEIYTPEDLAAIGQNPSGSYILMEDLDMSGIDWNCPDFSGKLDGNGHAILNLTITHPGPTTGTILDGNLNEYDSALAGMFANLDHAEIKNLKLLNLRALVESDTYITLGGVAAISKESTITDCEITATMELRAHEKIFDIAGVLGYGTGLVENCKIDVTLICVDTDDQTKDEQFLGGVFGTGFVSVVNCDIKIDGYISEHGYVHSGGVTGMLMQYPLSMENPGRIEDNKITGKITFFEDNYDRRAYCDAVCGEVVRVFGCSQLNNTTDFKRDELWDYTRELRPEMCEAPQITQNVKAPACGEFGWTEYACSSCGYTYLDSYTLPAHTVNAWVVTKEPTPETTGLSEGYCSVCGTHMEREEETLPPTEPTTEPETEPETVPAQTQPRKTQAESDSLLDAVLMSNWTLLFIFILLAISGLMLLAMMIKSILRGE